MVNIYDPKHYLSFAIDVTNRCIGKCEFCPRNNNFTQQIFPRGELDLDIFKKVFDHDYLNHMYNLIINGNLGEPVLYSRLFDLLDYVKENNPKLMVFISTNGLPRPTSWWKELAKKMSFNRSNIIRFCLDGLSDTHHLYRGTHYGTVLRNLISYINAGGRADWQFIVFKHNEHQLERAKKIATQIGCAGFATVISRHYNTDGTLERPTILDAKTKFELCEESCDKIFCTPVENHHLYMSHTGFVFPCCDYGLFEDFRRIEHYPPRLYIEYLRSLPDMDMSKSTLKDALNSTFFKYIMDNKDTLVRCKKSCTIQDNNRNEQILMRDTLCNIKHEDERYVKKDENIITNKVQGKIDLRTKKRPE